MEDEINNPSANTTAINPATPPAAAAPAVASPAAASTPSASSAPSVVQPVRRSGLAGIVDEIRDALAGTTTSHLYTDANGDKYVKNDTMSHGQQWLKIAGEAAQGAAAGYAAGKGAGNEGRAAMAGLAVGEQNAQQEKQNASQQQEEVKQQTLDKFNMIKLKQDVAASAFELTRRQTLATQQDVSFAQEQIDREKKLGSADLGIYKDPADLARVRQQNPEFWKNVYENNIVPVEEFGPDGKRLGIHVFLRTPGIGSQPVPSGTKVKDFVPGDKPGDPPKLVDRELSIPATHDQLDQWNNAAVAKYQQWQKMEQDRADKASQEKLRQAQTEQAQARTRESGANIAKTQAETAKLRRETALLSVANAGEDIESQAQALVDGRNAPSLLSRRSKDYNAILARADKLSMEKYGHPYDRNQGEINYQMFKSTLENYSGDHTGAKNIESFDKFLGHAMEASEAVNAARNTSVPLINTPYNKLRKLSGSERSPQVVALQGKLETVRKEFATFLENNHALTNEDKESAKAILDDNASPAQMQEALKSVAHIAKIRLRAMDYGFSRVAHTHIPDLVSPEGSLALQHFGIEPQSVYSQNAQQQPQGHRQGPQAQPPQGATMRVPGSDGKMHWSDGKRDLGVINE